jgi:adenosylcobyric acid synthase
VLGLCGGYQMLGRTIADPDGIEGHPGSVPGLGLLDVDTVLSGGKTLTEVAGVSLPDGVPFSGYEMHVGRTEGPDRARPLLRFADGRTDGATSADGRIRAAYVHGLFTDDRQRAAWLTWLGQSAAGLLYDESIDRVLDALAGHLELHVDLDRLLSLGGAIR